MMQATENTNGLPSFRIDSQQSDAEFDAAETIENLKQILTAGRNRIKPQITNLPEK